MMLGKLYIKWQVMRGKAVDIWSSGAYPSNVLSNLCSNRFCLDGVFCHSMEGFLQSLKYEDCDRQRQVCAMKGRKAKTKSTSSWQTEQVVWWKGRPIDRQGAMYQRLIRRAYRAMFEQNERFRAALMATRGMCLYHSRGERDKYRSILTEKEFTSILMDMRDTYRSDENNYMKRIFFDLDGLCVQSKECLMQPGSEVVDAFHQLSGRFDCYLLSVVPSDDTSLMIAKMLRVKELLGDYALGRMVIAPDKGILRGDILIETCGSDGTCEFEGECLRFGSGRFPDWNAILEYLLNEGNNYVEELG